MENVKDFKYLGSTVSKDGSLEGELKEAETFRGKLVHEPLQAEQREV